MLTATFHGILPKGTARLSRVRADTIPSADALVVESGIAADGRALVLFGTTRGGRDRRQRVILSCGYVDVATKNLKILGLFNWESCASVVCPPIHLFRPKLGEAS